jgi:hypothetical protein
MSCIRMNLWRGLSLKQITNHINKITTSIYSLEGETYGGYVRDYKLSEEKLITSQLDVNEILQNRKDYDAEVVINHKRRNQDKKDAYDNIQKYKKELQSLKESKDKLLSFVIDDKRQDSLYDAEPSNDSEYLLVNDINKNKVTHSQEKKAEEIEDIIKQIEKLENTICSVENAYNLKYDSLATEETNTFQNLLSYWSSKVITKDDILAKSFIENTNKNYRSAVKGFIQGDFKDIDCWFKNVTQHEELIAALRKLGYQIELLKIATHVGQVKSWENKYPFDVYRYHVWSVDGFLTFLDVVISEKFPCNDFSVNLISYNGKDFTVQDYLTQKITKEKTDKIIWINNKLLWTFNELVNNIKEKKTNVLPDFKNTFVFGHNTRKRDFEHNKGYMLL